MIQMKTLTVKNWNKIKNVQLCDVAVLFTKDPKNLATFNEAQSKTSKQNNFFF